MTRNTRTCLSKPPLGTLSGEVRSEAAAIPNQQDTVIGTRRAGVRIFRDMILTKLEVFM